MIASASVLVIGVRQVFKTTESSGSASNTGCGAGYNALHGVCL